MKKLYAYLLTVAVLFGAGSGQTAYALNPPVPVPRDILEMKLREFVRISARDFCRITGTKMNLVDRVSFSMLKMNMKKSVKKNPDLTVGQYLAAPTKQEIKWWAVILVIVVAALIIILLSSWKRDWDRGWGTFQGG